MRFLKHVQLLILAGLASDALAASGPLVWDSVNQTNHAKAADISSHFIFKVRNISDADVVITDLKTSCGCTVGTLPSKPWRLAPKEGGKMDVLVDLRGKHGTLFKSVDIQSATAPMRLDITVDIADGTNHASPEAAMREWGKDLAAIDRQAVFKTDCVRCHLVPAFGKSGEQLFHVTCGICHEAKNRATMVPDLKSLKTPVTSDYWRNWITDGKPGTLMPAFTATQGGPLDDAQINSLVQYLMDAYPRPLQK